MNNQRKLFFSGQHPFTMFIFSSLAVLVTGFIFQLIGFLLASVIYGVSLPELTSFQGSLEPKVLNAIKFLQIVGALGAFVFSSLLLSWFYTGSWTGFFPFGRGVSPLSLLLIALIMIVSLPFVNFLTDINGNFILPFEGVERYLRGVEEQTEALMMTLLRADTVGALLVNLFMIAIIPAVGEELVFRGLIQKHLTDWFKNGHMAILITAVIFSLAHFQIYSFLPRFFLGIILGYALFYGKSLWYPMLAHLVNNSLGVIYYFFYLKEKTGETIEQIGTMDMMPVTALLSLLIAGLLMVAWVRSLNSNRTAPSDGL